MMFESENDGGERRPRVRLTNARSRLVTGCTAGFVLAALAVPAAADEARDFLNVPTGSWYPAYYLVLSETRSPDGRTVIDSTTNLFRVTNTLNVFGRTGGWNVIVPLQTLSLSVDGDSASRKTNVGDPKFVFDVNLFGAPALGREEFRSYVPRPYASLHVAVTARRSLLMAR